MPGKTQASKYLDANVRPPHCTIVTVKFTTRGVEWGRKEQQIMIKAALFVRLEAKPGREKEVEDFLRSGLAIVEEEPATTAWFGIRLGPSTFGIFDAFPDDAGREAHLAGKVAAALTAKAGELFARPPSMEKADVLAAKLPG